jgi:hypothetical protein
VRGKKNEPLPPNEELLQLTDGEVTLEAKDLDDLRAQLREKYPEGAFERTLHYVRGPQGGGAAGERLEWAY